jgi:hypothetical protein
MIRETLSRHLLLNRQYLSIKIASLTLVGLALIAEMLPEFKAKLIVIPALLVTLALGIIEIRKEKHKSRDTYME